MRYARTTKIGALQYAPTTVRKSGICDTPERPEIGRGELNSPNIMPNNSFENRGVCDTHERFYQNRGVCNTPLRPFQNWGICDTPKRPEIGMGELNSPNIRQKIRPIIRSKIGEYAIRPNDPKLVWAN